MRASRIVTPLLAALVAQGVPVADSFAQLGLYTLPKSDFVWNWGQADLERRRAGMADIEVSGTEALFRCELTARLRASSPMSVTEVRRIESELQTRLDFIYAASEAMNYLEYQRALDWATLDCKKQESEPRTAEESAERQAEARAKMLRELERRRARQQRD